MERRATKKKDSLVNFLDLRASVSYKNENFNSYKVEQIEELKEIFKMYDRDNTGEITDRTLKFLLRGLGDNVSEDEAGYIKKTMDEDGNGTIDFREFMLYMLEKINNQSLCDDITEMFEVLDKDSTGYVNLTDLKIATAGLLQDSIVYDFFTNADLEKQGEINYKDYLKKLLK